MSEALAGSLPVPIQTDGSKASGRRLSGGKAPIGPQTTEDAAGGGFESVFAMVAGQSRPAQAPAAAKGSQALAGGLSMSGAMFGAADAAVEQVIRPMGGPAGMGADAVLAGMEGLPAATGANAGDNIGGLDGAVAVAGLTMALAGQVADAAPSLAPPNGAGAKGQQQFPVVAAEFRMASDVAAAVTGPTAGPTAGAVEGNSDAQGLVTPGSSSSIAAGDQALVMDVGVRADRPSEKGQQQAEASNVSLLPGGEPALATAMAIPGVAVPSKGLAVSPSSDDPIAEGARGVTAARDTGLLGGMVAATDSGRGRPSSGPSRQTGVPGTPSLLEDRAIETGSAGGGAFGEALAASGKADDGPGVSVDGVGGRANAPRSEVVLAAAAETLSAAGDVAPADRGLASPVEAGRQAGAHQAATPETSLTPDAAEARARGTEVARQVGLRIAAGAKDGTDSIRVELTPPELGRVEVRLQHRDGQVAITVSAERADTLEALRASRVELERQLVEAGVKLDGGQSGLSFGRYARQDRDDAEQAIGAAIAARVAAQARASVPEAAVARRSSSLIDIDV